MVFQKSSDYKIKNYFPGTPMTVRILHIYLLWRLQLIRFTASKLKMTTISTTHHNVWTIRPRNLQCERGIKPTNGVVQGINVVVMCVDAHRVPSNILHWNKVHIPVLINVSYKCNISVVFQDFSKVLFLR
jgi:hypothetical protein